MARYASCLLMVLRRLGMLISGSRQLRHPDPDIQCRAAGANVGTGYRGNRVRDPPHGNRDMIRSHDIATCGIESLPAGARKVHFGPGMG